MYKTNALNRLGLLRQQRKAFLAQSTLAAIVFFALPGPAFAADLQDILVNLRSVLGPIMTLLLIISYIAGIVMIIRGLAQLKSFGGQQAKPGEFTGPLVYIIVGTVLLYLPSTTDVVTRTIFGTDAASIVEGSSINLSALGQASDKLMGYAPVAIEGQWADLIDTIILYVQFIGFVAFIRGWFIIAHAGQSGAQPGNISKGVTHIIGGIIAVNFLPMVDILHTTVFGG